MSKVLFFKNGKYLIFIFSFLNYLSSNFLNMFLSPLNKMYFIKMKLQMAAYQLYFEDYENGKYIF